MRDRIVANGSKRPYPAAPITGASPVPMRDIAGPGRRNPNLPAATPLALQTTLAADIRHENRPTASLH
jgi:hypothetical protein